MLDKAARTASRIGHAISYEPETVVPNGVWYKDRRWLNVFPGNATFTAETFNFIDPRTGFFINAYSTSPGMAVTMVNVGAKYPATFVDANGDFLSGSASYKLHLPKGIPAALFWSVTVYDSITASGLDNGQPFPSINTMDKPMKNNEKNLSDAQSMFNRFATEREPDLLRDSYMTLDNVNLTLEGDESTRNQYRAKSLELWLQLLQLLDQLLDPNFNPDDEPVTLVTPPSTPGGVTYRPGVDPAKIDDPKARAEYEKAIAANRIKTQNYRLQVHLRRLDERLPSRAEAFMRSAFGTSQRDRDELRVAIAASKIGAKRKESLLRLVAGPK
jgi:hypothetical protein